MPYTSLSDFKARNGITVSTYDAQLTFLLNTFSGVIDEEVDGIFTLTPKTANDEVRFFGQPAGSSYVQTPIWQATDLIVKKGCFGSSELKTLIKNTDYYLEPVFGKRNPVIGINLPYSSLYSHEFLQLEGTFGFSNGLPPSLLMLIDQAVLIAMSYRLRSQNQLTKGKGNRVQSERSGNLSITFASGQGTEEVEKYGAALNSGNLLAMPEISSSLFYYKSLLITNILKT